MTREEAIEAMARAIYEATLEWQAGQSTKTPNKPTMLAAAALDAALPWVEGLVQQGAVSGWLRSDGNGPQAGAIDDIVARVMEGK